MLLGRPGVLACRPYWPGPEGQNAGSATSSRNINGRYTAYYRVRGFTVGTPGSSSVSGAGRLASGLPCACELPLTYLHDVLNGCERTVPQKAGNGKKKSSRLGT